MTGRSTQLLVAHAGRMAAAALLLVAATAASKELYVDNKARSCSDETSYERNGPEWPWCTIGRAAWGSADPDRPRPAQAARAGDTVLIAAGVYMTAAPAQRRCERWGVALNPAHGGTRDAPLTFRGVGTVDIRLGAGHSGPTIGAAGRDFVVWDNVRIDEQAAPGASCPDTGPVVLLATRGSRILNSTIRGKFRTWGDNYNGIRTERVDGAVIAHNRIHDVTCDSGHNCAAIMMYDTANTVIEHNLIRDSITGIYVKGDHVPDDWPQEHNTVRFNWFENLTSKAIFLYTARGTRVYQNVVKDAPYAIRVWGAEANADIVIANNTFVSTGRYLDAGGYSVYGFAETLRGLRFYNNAVYGPFGEAVNMGDVKLVGGQSFDHNVYAGYKWFGSLAGSRFTRAEWSAVHGQDRAGAASRIASLTFADPQRFTLPPGVPARTAGLDILDLNRDDRSTDAIPVGAYVVGDEVIGPQAEGSSTPRR